MTTSPANTNSTGSYNAQTGDVIKSTATASNISKKYTPSNDDYNQPNTFDIHAAQLDLRERQANAAEQDAGLAGDLPNNNEAFLADNDPMAFDDTISTNVPGPDFDTTSTVDPVFLKQVEDFGGDLETAGAYGSGPKLTSEELLLYNEWQAGKHGQNLKWPALLASHRKLNPQGSEFGSPSPLFGGYDTLDGYSTDGWSDDAKQNLGLIQNKLNPQTAEGAQFETDRLANEARIAAEAAVADGDVKTDFLDYTFRGSNTENSLRQQNLDIKYYKVNFDNEYIKEDGTVRKDLAWSPEAQRGYNPQDYTHKTLFNPSSAYTTGTDASGKQAQTSTKFRTSLPQSLQGGSQSWTPEDKQEVANYLNTTIPGSENNELDYFPGEASDANPDGGQLKEYAPEFDNPKGGPTWVDTSDLDRVYGAGQGKAGFEKQINKQNANRAYKTIIGEWQSGFLTGGGSQSKAKSFVDKKISLMDSWGGKDNDLGGYKKMFKKDIKSRYTNLYGMYSPANNTKPVDKYTSFKSVFNDGKVTASTRVKDDRLTNAAGLAMSNNPMDSYTKQLKNSTKTWKDYYKN